MKAQVIERATNLWAEGERWEAILAALRADGFSKVESIRATVELLRLPLGEAKWLVHNSATWSDSKAKDDAWQERLVAELEPVF